MRKDSRGEEKHARGFSNSRETNAAEKAIKSMQAKFFEHKDLVRRQLKNIQKITVGLSRALTPSVEQGRPKVAPPPPKDGVDSIPPGKGY